jgi:hypothetical protein
MPGPKGEHLPQFSRLLFIFWKKRGIADTLCAPAVLVLNGAEAEEVGIPF